MIEDYAPATQLDEARLIVRPNRSLTAPQLVRVVLAFALLALLVSGLSWWQGNAFAPLFAVLQVLWLGGCLALVWRRGDRLEVISVSPRGLAVRRLPELSDRLLAHPARVRVEAVGGRVMLCAGARRVEVGECLNSLERASLARRLGELLRWAGTA